MRNGKLRHLVQIQNLDETQNETTGEMVSTWVHFAWVWASIEPLSAREFIQSNAVQSQIDSRIVIRFRSDLSPKMRIVYRGAVYKIEGLLPDTKSGIEYLTIPVRTLQGASGGYAESNPWSIEFSEEFG